MTIFFNRKIRSASLFSNMPITSKLLKQNSKQNEMSDLHSNPKSSTSCEPQCKFFVVRKKRLCRMTVKPGRDYCGEHEPQPRRDGQDDTRIPCPYDSKHTCYASKLEKHLSICNARPHDLPPYIVQSINAPCTIDICERIPLQLLEKETIAKVIDKVNLLYEKHLQDQITTLPDQPIHSAVLEEYSQTDRAESSLRHLRQTSRLLHILQDEGLVEDQTCYVELGAGKGQLSFYICKSYCSNNGSAVLLVDRASLRHKRDNKLGCDVTTRIRADLAHLALEKVPLVEDRKRVVGAAKHLCGVATDYALRCLTGEGVLNKTSGVVLATCCHHRCERAGYVANKQLQDLGITAEDLNVMLGIVSWATCGDGRSRDKRRADNDGTNQTTCVQNNESGSTDQNCDKIKNGDDVNDNRLDENRLKNNNENVCAIDFSEKNSEHLVLPQEYREMVGRRAKALLDWGRVLYLRECGFDAHLCHYVSTKVSLENVCIIARKTVS